MVTFSPTDEPASYARVSVLGQGSREQHFANVTKHVNAMGMALWAKVACDDDQKPVDRFGCVLVLYTGKKDDARFLEFFRANAQWISVFFLKVYVCEGSPGNTQTRLSRFRCRRLPPPPSSGLASAEAAERRIQRSRCRRYRRQPWTNWAHR